MVCPTTVGSTVPRARSEVWTLSELGELCINSRRDLLGNGALTASGSVPAIDVHGVKAQLFPLKKITDRRLAGVATLCNLVDAVVTMADEDAQEPTLVVVATPQAAAVAKNALTDFSTSRVHQRTASTEQELGSAPTKKYRVVSRDVASVVKERFLAVVAGGMLMQKGVDGKLDEEGSTLSRDSARRDATDFSRGHDAPVDRAPLSEQEGNELSTEGCRSSRNTEYPSSPLAAADHQPAKVRLTFSADAITLSGRRPRAAGEDSSSSDSRTVRESDDEESPPSPPLALQQADNHCEETPAMPPPPLEDLLAQVGRQTTTLGRVLRTPRRSPQDDVRRSLLPKPKNVRTGGTKRGPERERCEPFQSKSSKALLTGDHDFLYESFPGKLERGRAEARPEIVGDPGDEQRNQCVLDAGGEDHVLVGDEDSSAKLDFQLSSPSKTESPLVISQHTRGAFYRLPCVVVATVDELPSDCCGAFAHVVLCGLGVTETQRAISAVRWERDEVVAWECMRSSDDGEVRDRNRTVEAGWDDMMAARQEERAARWSDGRKENLVLFAEERKEQRQRRTGELENLLTSLESGGKSPRPCEYGYHPSAQLLRLAEILRDLYWHFVWGQADRRWKWPLDRFVNTALEFLKFSKYSIQTPEELVLQTFASKYGLEEEEVQHRMPQTSFTPASNERSSQRDLGAKRFGDDETSDDGEEEDLLLRIFRESIEWGHESFIDRFSM